MISETAVKLRFLELGFLVLEPMGDKDRFDCIIDRGDGAWFEKVQIKTLRRSGGVLTCRTCRQIKSNGKMVWKKYAPDEVDIFAAYDPIGKKVYLIPLIDIVGFSISLRIDPAGNNQGSGIRWAADYEL